MEPGWGDYFDKFLLELKCCCLVDEGKWDRNFKTLVDAHEYYLKIFSKTSDKFLKFCEINYFKDYYLITGSSKVNPMFKPYIGFRKGSNNVVEKYKAFANNYIDKPTDIINKRAADILKIIDNKRKS